LSKCHVQPGTASEIFLHSFRVQCYDDTKFLQFDFPLQERLSMISELVRERESVQQHLGCTESANALG